MARLGHGNPTLVVAPLTERRVVFCGLRLRCRRLAVFAAVQNIWVSNVQKRAIDDDPAAHQALELIGALYEVEKAIRDRRLEGAAKLDYRSRHAHPVVEAFFGWCHAQLQRVDLVTSAPLARALVYADRRQAELRVYLGDPDVPIDTTHLERALRVIAMGHKNWLFCRTEVGAQHVGIIQSLLTTCRLQGVDPYTYLVDLLQRGSLHPAR